MLIRLIKVLCVNAYKKPIQLDRDPFISYVPLHSFSLYLFLSCSRYFSHRDRKDSRILAFFCLLLVGGKNLSYWGGTENCSTNDGVKFSVFEHVLFKFASRQRCRIVTDLCYLLKTKPNVIDGSLTLAFSASVVSTVVFFFVSANTLSFALRLFLFADFFSTSFSLDVCRWFLLEKLKNKKT